MLLFIIPFAGYFAITISLAVVCNALKSPLQKEFDFSPLPLANILSPQRANEFFKKSLILSDLDRPCEMMRSFVCARKMRWPVAILPSLSAADLCVVGTLESSQIISDSRVFFFVCFKELTFLEIHHNFQISNIMWEMEWSKYSFLCENIIGDGTFFLCKIIKEMEYYSNGLRSRNQIRLWMCIEHSNNIANYVCTGAYWRIEVEKFCFHSQLVPWSLRIDLNSINICI